MGRALPWAAPLQRFREHNAMDCEVGSRAASAMPTGHAGVGYAAQPVLTTTRSGEVRGRVCLRSHTHTHAHMCAHMHARTHTRVRASTNAHTHTHAHIYTYTHTRAHARTHAHTRARTHTHHAQPRFCKKCVQPKPDRAHHCRCTQ
jgi:hypothetical protein